MRVFIAIKGEGEYFWPSEKRHFLAREEKWIRTAVAWIEFQIIEIGSINIFSWENPAHWNSPGWANL